MATLTPEVLANLQALAPGMDPSRAEAQLTESYTPWIGDPRIAGALGMWNEALAPVRRVQAEREARADPRYGMSPEQRAAFDANAANEQRYLTDLSFLDPSLRYSAATLGQSAGSQVNADPAAIQAQQQALGTAGGLANSPLNFRGQGTQATIGNRWAQIGNGWGAPTFMGNAQQQQLMQQMLGQTSTTGPGALQFESPARQAEQYGNLQGIIAGGGADAIERAMRANARADSEAWLRGQREADMADYAERGLTGSGMELLALNTDRQGAAQRNNLADLNMAAALEQRRMDAINSAGGLATSMRGQTAEEQGLLANRTANALSQATGLANTMRSQDYNERAYLDERMLGALQQQTELENTMRNQQYQEQIGGRNAQLDALRTQADLATNLRNSSFNEGQSRANAADQFAILNHAAVNQANSQNAGFLQQAQQNAMAQRNSRYLSELALRVGAAQNQDAADRSENAIGFNQGTNVGTNTANQFNNGLYNYNNAVLGQNNIGSNNVAAAQQQHNALYPALGQFGGQVINSVINGAANSGSGSGGGGFGQIGPMLSAIGSGGGGTQVGPTQSALGVDQYDPTKRYA